MNQQYTFIDVIPLNGEIEHTEFMVAMLSWLISELTIELKDELDDVEMEVIKMHGKFGGAYPTIALYSDTIKWYDARYKLIDATCRRIMQDKPAIKFIEFATQGKQDWSKITAKIME